MSLPAVPRAVRRRAPRPCDPTLDKIQHRIAQLNLLKTLAVTQEYNDIANAIVTHTGSPYQADPSLNDTSLSFYTYMSELQTFADPKYTIFVGAMTALSPDETAPMKENKASFSRDHRWTWNFGNDLYITVQLNAAESEGTSSCRKVQVGTKTIEQPIYSYDCAMEAEPSGLIPAPVIDPLQIG